MRVLATSSSTSSRSMKIFLTEEASSSFFLFDSASVMRLIVQPVSSEARRTFWPLRPIAMARFSSSTTTSMACLSSSTRIEDTSAGASAPITNCAGSSDHNTMSTRSHAVAHPQILLGDHLVARQHRFHAPDLDDRVAALDALDRAVDELFAAA